MQNQKTYSHIQILDKDAHWMHYIITENLSFKNDRIAQNISTLWIRYIYMSSYILL